MPGTGINPPGKLPLTLVELLNVVLCSPLVFGLMRIPAMRSIGCASSAIGGYRSGCPCMAKVRVGLMVKVGVTGAFRAFSTAFDGF